MMQYDVFGKTNSASSAPRKFSIVRVVCLVEKEAANGVRLGHVIRSETMFNIIHLIQQRT